MKVAENRVADGRTRMHNVRFYGLAPRGIKCMSFNNHSKKLALSRYVLSRSSLLLSKNLIPETMHPLKYGT